MQAQEVAGITLPFQVNFHVPSLIIQIIIYFVCPYRSRSDEVVNSFHAKRVILMMGAYSLVLHERGS